MNSLAYRYGAFDNISVLSSTYNAIHRVQMLRPHAWKRWDPAIVHIVGDRKPWSQQARTSARTSCSSSGYCNNNPYFAQEREWLRVCAAQ